MCRDGAYSDRIDAQTASPPAKNDWRCFCAGVLTQKVVLRIGSWTWTYFVDTLFWGSNPSTPCYQPSTLRAFSLPREEMRALLHDLLRVCDTNFSRSLNFAVADVMSLAMVRDIKLHMQVASGPAQGTTIEKGKSVSQKREEGNCSTPRHKIEDAHNIGSSEGDTFRFHLGIEW